MRLNNFQQHWLISGDDYDRVGTSRFQIWLDISTIQKAKEYEYNSGRDPFNQKRRRLNKRRKQEKICNKIVNNSV